MSSMKIAPSRYGVFSAIWEAIFEFDMINVPLFVRQCFMLLEHSNTPQKNALKKTLNPMVVADKVWQGSNG
ncbi:hypothetical protein EU677_24495 [Escherichia coli]|uniref:hypothetical protein n=1 Tax=Escherichia coli TaxID=562 RepID=UPI001D88CB93|nr:hypothetical protein [Escherichia coli]EEY6024977.1 hypothetical protein [Escherichia coli]EHU6079631.1 hypothetical protein [Escherichia coli]MBB6804998.1 hypothetical protein [Escherichia coli]MCW9859605.1 hypothetical protein [Escherichia coli]